MPIKVICCVAGRILQACIRLPLLPFQSNLLTYGEAVECHQMLWAIEVRGLYWFYQIIGHSWCVVQEVTV